MTPHAACFDGPVEMIFGFFVCFFFPVVAICVWRDPSMLAKQCSWKASVISEKNDVPEENV